MKKSMMSTRHMSTKSKSSKSTKSSKSSSSSSDYDDLPLCSDLTHAPTVAPTFLPTVGPTTEAERTACQAMLDGTGTAPENPNQQAAVFAVLVGDFDDDVIDKLEAGLRAVLAIAAGCNVQFSLGRRRLDGDSDSDGAPTTRFYFDEITLLGISGMQASSYY